MGKVVIGTFLFVVGLFFCFTGVGVVIGLPMFGAGLFIAISGFGSMGIGAAKLGFKAANLLTSEGPTPSAVAAFPDADLAKWKVLVEVDPAIAAAAAKAREHSVTAANLLARKYMVLQDKQYLDAALEKAIAEANEAIAKTTMTEERKAQLAERFKIGDSTYRITEAGTYQLTKGKQVGRIFATAEELATVLGVPENSVARRA
ncbi:hypothetical protein [Rhizobium ruizarguesonis]|uniref:hypothetical protein n=1 Tax=Rhizobium ruizarguesonis TaxID=2081791 RepID=UPI0010319141|nr:hypothetical protein [Rhizobium ruizarguesonis]TBE87846.1 hypothetical protein ELG99_13905 [Rhizobium ruizarguesonis]